MPNYRRLISYIYAYEGAVKGKNIGFAKIETRGVQCKITVSVKRIYVGGNDIGVYLLSADQEILLGNIFIRGGSGEFRTVVSASDIEHSGISVEQCFGLTIHDVKNTWRSYTTIWEDAVAHAAEVDLESTARLVPGKEQAVISEEQIKRAVREIEEEFPLEPDSPGETAQEKISSDERKNEESVPVSEVEKPQEEKKVLTENIEAESQSPDGVFTDSVVPAGEEMGNVELVAADQKQVMAEDTETAKKELQHTYEAPTPINAAASSEAGIPAEAYMLAEEYIPAEAYLPAEEAIPAEAYIPVEAYMTAEVKEPITETMQEASQSVEEPVSGEWENTGQEDSLGEIQEMEEVQEPRETMDVQEREPVISEPYPCDDEDFAGDTILYRADAVLREDTSNPEVRPELGNPDELERLRQNEDQDEAPHDMIWEKLKREHTRILAFDYEDGCEILTIKPQDIGMLPRDTWVFGNNSFLLHGYYNYRYLILAKLLSPSGMPRYLLGIPGHYYSNERYMASMFGFPNFVLSKDQPMEEGRFGFWYTDIKLGG